jgi:putative ABC transport system permease protein
MSFLRRFFARLAGVFTGHTRDDDLRAELQSHLDMEIAELIRRGMDPDAARRQALLASGGITQSAEAVRDQRGLPWLENLAADIKYAVRALRHSPGFTLVTVLTLGLGIGANTAIFSVVRGVLLKPLPNKQGDRLIYLRHSFEGPGGSNVGFSVPEVRDFRAGAKALGGIAEYSPITLTLLGDEAARIDIGLVTGNFFEVMGLSPVVGRLTVPSDDGSGVPAVVVLSHDFWMKRFGGDSGVIGRQIRLEAGSATIIGVLQPAPFFPQRVDGFMNMVISPHHLSAFMVTNRSHRMTEIVARLAPGASLQQARTQVATVDARVQREHPESYDAAAHYQVALIPFKEALGQKARLTLGLLMAAAAFVLVIAAANVVNLTLMRGINRSHELVARAALGAGVGRLRRLLLAENLLLTLVGGGLGILLAVGGVGLLTSLAARYSPRADEIRLDGMVLGFALTLSLLLALLLSFVAALPKEGTLAAWLAAGGRRLSGGSHKHRLQRALVVAQVAVSVVLLAGAGLLTRTMLRLSEVETGLQTEQILTMQIPIIGAGRFSPQAIVEARTSYDRIKAELLALPGVKVVGLGGTVPLRSSIMSFNVQAEGKPLAVGAALPSAELRTADPDYFRAAGIPLLKGREFQATDRDSSAQVVIVNQRLVDRFFPHEDPIGKRIAWTGEILKVVKGMLSDEWRTIVGVVGNTQDGGLDAPPRLAVFQPYAQMVPIGGAVVIRADGDLTSLAATATRIARHNAPTAPVENVLTVSQIKAESIAPRRLNAELVSSFGLLALVIAAVGIAGVLAFSVSGRTNEIGIRMSLGADAGRVQRMILREGGALLVIGLGVGVVGAFFTTGLIRGLLFGVAPRDPVTFSVVAVLMAAIGTAACWIPALRASRVDPAITMRSE